MFRVEGLRCEYKENPVGIDVRNPRIGWRIVSEERATFQTAYRIQVSADPTFGTSFLWDSGKIASDRQNHVEIKEIPSLSRKRFYYRVQAWNQRDERSDWSEPSFWETGLLESADWTAEWIAAPDEVCSRDGSRCPMLRKSFELRSAVRDARLYATALGLYEISLNGRRVGDRYFTPGWTSYNNRLQYQTYDVTDMLEPGGNAIGCLLGNGWYKGDLGGEGKRNHYGDRLALLAQLHVTYEDGTEDVISTDATWKAAASPILSSEIYHGETYDARLEQEGWNASDFRDDDWKRVEMLGRVRATLVAQQSEPVQRIETIKPIALLRTPKGETVLDFGQNMVGWVRFAVAGQAGDEVMLEHAEVLDGDGNVYTDNLRDAKQTIRYVLKGRELETYEPRFTFQGFRYVRLTGFGEPVAPERFEGVVLHTNMKPTGFFACSDPMINQLQHNILWGLKGNFLDVPTDCPQRDERLGWTGDAQMFIRTASYLMNVDPFFTKWLSDLKAEQAKNGGVPHVVPNVFGDGAYSSAAWGDASVIVPWTLYAVYGDVRILEEQYDSMKAWVEHIRAAGDDEYLWNSGGHFGDWLALDAQPGSYTGSTDKHFIATAFYAYSTSLLHKAAAVLGRSDDARRYAALFENIAAAFEREYVTPSGRLAVSTQTAQVLGLKFGLLRGAAKERAVRTLLQLLEETGFHLTTGFVGTPYLNHVLSENGHTDTAYKLLFQKDYPSWLYQVGMGATTVWEHWDGIREDGSFWSPKMNSFNHYAYGAIGDWMYRRIAGIDMDDCVPAYKKQIIRPQPPAEGIEWAEGRLDTMYGTVRSYWRRRPEGTMELHVTIPPNTRADVVLPGAAGMAVTESGADLRSSAGVFSAETSGDDLLLTAGSGEYVFVWSAVRDSQEGYG